MKIQAPLQPKPYLTALKNRMDSPFHFGAERCTGYFLGPVVSVTHHYQWEWNMRMIAPKNTAVGFVRKTRDGCAFHCIILKGLLAPHLFVLTFLLASAIWLSISAARDNLPEMLPLCLPVCLGATAVLTATSAMLENMADESQEGRRILQSVLLDPSDPFTYLNHKDELS